jgi:predicted nucleic acid-binding Zn ribbon protein
MDPEEDEIEMPEGGWECSECGAPVENMNDVCSRNCFNAMMR